MVLFKTSKPFYFILSYNTNYRIVRGCILGSAILKTCIQVIVVPLLYICKHTPLNVQSCA